MLKNILTKFLGEDGQSKNIQINSLLTACFRALGILCNFLLVPVMLNYLDKNNYGVWLTLTSLTAWLSFMDVGLGNGMRNKLAEAIAQGDKRLAKEYISTTYVIFTLIMICLFLCFALINPFLQWDSILKTTLKSYDLIILTYVLVFSFCLRLVLDLSGMIIVAMHKPYIKAGIDFAINLVTLILVYTLITLKYNSFLIFGILISIIPVIILLLFSLYIFRKRSKYNYLKPSLGAFKRNHIKSLLGLGIKFFAIQLSTLIIFSTDNLLITQIFSPGEVASFNISYKYFSIMAMCFSIMLLPYWSAFTSAYFKRETTWIKNAFRKLILFWIIQVLIVGSMVFAAPFVYRLWVGKSVEIPFRINLTLGLFTIICNWNNIFVYFLNGVSKIQLQIYNAIFIVLINIPLSYYLANVLNLGPSSVVLSNCICLFFGSIWAPIQCYKIINNKAEGIWNK